MEEERREIPTAVWKSLAISVSLGLGILFVSGAATKNPLTAMAAGMAAFFIGMAICLIAWAIEESGF